MNALMGGKMYKLLFIGNDEACIARFKRCYTAVVMTGRQLAVSEWDDAIALLKALKKIGRDTGNASGLDVPADYVLSDEGGEILLQRSEYNLLLELLKQPIWRPTVLETVKETRTWLEGLKAEEVTKTEAVTSVAAPAVLVPLQAPSVQS